MKKESELINFPNQESMSNLSKNDRFEKKESREIKNEMNYSEEVLKSESSHNKIKGSIDDIRSKLTNKMRIRKSMESQPQ